MSGSLQFLRVTAVTLLAWSALAGGQTIWADPCYRVPTGGGCVCVPNAANFGHFPTRWRQWPTEPRPDIAEPQSLGAEVVPPPAGAEQVPLPEPAAPSRMPTGVTPEEKTLPQEGGLRIQPSLPVLPGPAEQPAEPPVAPPRELFPATPSTRPSPPIAEPPISEPPLSEPSMREPSRSQPAATPELPLRTPPRTDSLTPPAEPPLQEPAPVPPRDGSALPKLGQALVAADAVARDEVVPPETARASHEASFRDRVPRPLQANWMAALNPGFRGDALRSTPAAVPIPAAKPALDPTPVDSGATFAGGATAGGPAENHSAVHPEDARPSAHAGPALDGFCPVELLTNERWVPGDAKWSSVHRGKSYLFSGPTQRTRFLAHPERYAPACSGQDPVLLVGEGRQVAGQTEYCLTYQGRLYMFANAETLAQFQNHPHQYVASEPK